MDISSPRIVFAGNLEYGDDADGELAYETTHIWHFMGESGDNVSISIIPYDESDCVLQIYRPGGLENLLVEQDEGEEGENEDKTIQLDETGMYSIVVKEYYGNVGSYYISINSN
jgi:hypothetical protein